jgi:hypothetical protein
MEVVEIISSYINKDNNILRVEFRFMGDEGIRQDVIEFEYMKDFGYYEGDMMEVFESIDIDDEDWDDWDTDEDEVFIDDETLISFLNEYYIVFPDKIPDEEYN